MAIRHRFCHECGQMFAPDVLTCPGDGTPLLPVGAEGDLTGQTLMGKYLLLKLLGQGASARSTRRSTFEPRPCGP